MHIYFFAADRLVAMVSPTAMVKMIVSEIVVIIVTAIATATVIALVIATVIAITILKALRESQDQAWHLDPLPSRMIAIALTLTFNLFLMVRK